MMIDLAVYAGLFATAFASATILPLQSEAALVGLLLAQGQPAWALLLVAAVGNTAGSIVNWGLGRCIDQVRHKSWFPVSPASLERAQAWYRHYGRWSLLLSWLPIVGDPLTLAAGIMRERFAVFVLLVAIAKTGRYLALAAIVLGWMD